MTKARIPRIACSLRCRVEGLYDSEVNRHVFCEHGTSGANRQTVLRKKKKSIFRGGSNTPETVRITFRDVSPASVWHSCRARVFNKFLQNATRATLSHSRVRTSYRGITKRSSTCRAKTR